MMRQVRPRGCRLVVGPLLAIGLSIASPIHAGELELRLHAGRVTLIARDVTAQEILAEWARIGHTTIVNLDTVSGGAMTLEFRDVPERMVLDVLLRSVGGYLAAPRATAMPAASMYDRVLVMAAGTTSPSGGARTATPPPNRGAGRTPTSPAFGFGNTPSPFGLPAPDAATAPAFLGPPGTEPDDSEAQPEAMTLDRPYPTPAAQPLTPLLPGDVSSQGTPPSAANPWGIPAGAASRPGVIVQPPDPNASGRTP